MYAKKLKRYTDAELDAEIERERQRRAGAFELRAEAAALVNRRAADRAFREWRAAGQRLKRLWAEKRRRSLED